MKLEEEIGTRLLALRERQNWNQRAFADELGASQQMVSLWERGGVPDSFLVLHELRRRFGVDLNRLIGGK